MEIIIHRDLPDNLVYLHHQVRHFDLWISLDESSDNTSMFKLAWVFRKRLNILPKPVWGQKLPTGAFDWIIQLIRFDYNSSLGIEFQSVQQHNTWTITQLLPDIAIFMIPEYFSALADFSRFPSVFYFGSSYFLSGITWSLQLAHPTIDSDGIVFPNPISSRGHWKWNDSILSCASWTRGDNSFFYLLSSIIFSSIQSVIKTCSQ